MITKNLNSAVNELRNNDLVAIPTETVYGLAGNALSEIAIQKIYALKKRPHYNPLIVHIKSIEQLKDVAREIPEIAYKIAQNYWPGPLTLILKKQKQIPDSVTSGLNTVAVRVPNHPLTLELLNKLDFPLVAPSANPFGLVSPTSALHVQNYFGKNLKVILDGGICERGIESTIIGFENNEPVIYRLGSLTSEEIESAIGITATQANKNDLIISPGMLSRHYAPKTQSYLTDNMNGILDQFSNQSVGLMRFKNELEVPENFTQKILSQQGDFNEVAKNLYATMHHLDNSNLDAIIMEMLPNYGLGKSINDRLRRAAKTII